MVENPGRFQFLKLRLERTGPYKLDLLKVERNKKKIELHVNRSYKLAANLWCNYQILRSGSDFKKKQFCKKTCY